MKIKYEANFEGYLILLRSIQKLLTIPEINFTQIGAYICFVSQADWHRKHKHYGAIIRDDLELARAWNCDYTTVRRNRLQLINLGLLYMRDGITYVKNFSMFEISSVKAILKAEIRDSHIYYLKSQEYLDEVLFQIDNSQDK